MFLKILILDVHRQKNFGNLKGSTPKEQYDYYEKKYLRQSKGNCLRGIFIMRYLIGI